MTKKSKYKKTRYSNNARFSNSKTSSNYYCSLSSFCSWLFPLIILAVILNPNWYGTQWVKWTIAISAAIIILNQLTQCRK